MKKKTRTAGLWRVCEESLVFKGLRCGLEFVVGVPCGGVIVVKDWHSAGIRGDGRYEVFCLKCSNKDPNGYARQEQLPASAREYFKAYEVSETIE